MKSLDDPSPPLYETQSLRLFCRHAADDVTVTWICDAEGAHSEVFTTGCSKLDVVTGVVVDTGLGQHGVVFNLAFPEWGCVVGQDDQFAFALPQGFECLFVTKMILATLHHQLEASVDALHLLLLFFGRHHFAFVVFSAT